MTPLKALKARRDKKKAKALQAQAQANAQIPSQPKPLTLAVVLDESKEDAQVDLDEEVNVRYQRFESPRPTSTIAPSPSQQEQHPSVSLEQSGNEIHDDLSESCSVSSDISFAPNEVSDTESYSIDENDNDSCNGDNRGPRPQSANSFASVLKSVASHTQIISDHFTLCGAKTEVSDVKIPTSFSNYKNNHAFNPPTMEMEPPPATVQLRHIQSETKSSSFQSHRKSPSDAGLRRSSSSPAKFLQSKSGSAFGRVSSSSSLYSSSSNKFAVVSDPGGSSVPVVISSSKNPTAAPTVTRSSAFNRVGGPFTVRRNSSLNKSVASDADSVVSNSDEISVSSNRSFSVKDVKNKRRQRLQRNGKEKEEATKQQQEAILLEQKLISVTVAPALPVKSSDTKRKEEDDLVRTTVDKSNNKTAFSMLSSPSTRSSRSDFTTTVKEESIHVEADTIKDDDFKPEQEKPVQNQESISYLPLDSEVIDEEPNEDDSLVADAEELAFMPQQTNTPLSRCQESPTPIPVATYEQIIDDDQTASHTHLPPQPRHYRRHTRTPPNTASPHSYTRPETPVQPPKVLSLKQTLQVNMSPCSQDSCAQSRMTSRSGNSNNTSNQTHSTSLSGRSVTSSVAEADREVRDTNRRELRRRVHGNDYDGGVSVQSSDTTSTNPNAYFALTSSPAPREGASLPVERFFAGNASIGMGSQSSGASSGGNHGSRRNLRSPITILNNRQLHPNTPEEPPCFVSCAPKPTLPPPMSFSNKVYPSTSSSLKSSSSGSTSSRSKRKEKNKMRDYQNLSSTAYKPLPVSMSPQQNRSNNNWYNPVVTPENKLSAI